MRRTWILALGLACAAVLPARAQEAPATPPQPRHRTAIDRLVKPFVEGGHLVGVSVGVLDAGGPRSWGYGKTGLVGEGASAPDGRTVYEIGSISKVFTGVLLAIAAERGEVQLTQQAASLLPEGRTLPAAGETHITLLDLATHTSGLPRMPSNFAPADRTNPYADYTAAQMFEFLAGAKLASDPGTTYAYSNLGAGLLGDLLSRSASTSYEGLLRDRITRPLGMAETSIALTQEQRARFARPHRGDGSPSSEWDIPALAGAGAIRSTVDDMLKFAAANFDTAEDAPLRTPLLQARIRKRAAGKAGIGLGWMLSPAGVTWHNGQTGGYHSYLGLDVERRLAVVVLSNTANGHPDAIGRAILEILAGRSPALQAPPKPAELSAETLARYEGSYRHPAGAVLTITRDGTKLFAQMTGQPKFRIFPESERAFVWRVVKAKAIFAEPADGKSPRLVLHQNGRKVPFERE